MTKMLTALFDDVHADDVVIGAQADTADTAADAAHWAGVFFVEADGLAVAGLDDDFVVATSHANPLQFIAFVEVDGDQPAGTDVLVLLERRLLDDTTNGTHDEVGSVVGLADVDDAADGLFWLQLQQVDQSDALGAQANALALRRSSGGRRGPCW